MTDPLTPEIIRSHFDIPDDLAFFNMSSKSAIPTSTVAAGQNGAITKSRPWTIDAEGDRARAEDIRKLFAALIGAEAGDIAFQPSAAYGIATAARNLSISAGQRIIILEDQFPSNALVWHDLAARNDAEVMIVPRPEDHDWARAVIDCLDERVAICALPPGHWTDGTKVDLERIAPKLKDINAAFVVDATQWAGVQPIDVRALGIDFMATAAYKWLLGPYGLSFFYASPGRQDGIPLEFHGNNHKRTAANTADSTPANFADGGRRYDAGEYMNFITLPMIHNSLQQVHAWGGPSIGERLGPVTQKLAEGAGAMGYKMAPPEARSAHILTLHRDQPIPAQAADQLASDNVWVSARGDGLRFSPYLFANTQDIDRALVALEKLSHHL